MKEQLSRTKFGRLTVLLKDESRSARTVWVCLCDCGVHKSVRADHLKSGRVVSCGCHRGELAGNRERTHGKSKTKIYRIWRNMINRCHYEKWPERHLYGGRGIVVCDRWRESFEAFYSDMGDVPDGKSIDRYPNKNGNYEPGNCRWATAKE